MGWPKLKKIDPLLEQLLSNADFGALISAPDVSLLIAVLDQAFMDIRYHKDSSHHTTTRDTGPQALAWMRERTTEAPPFLSFESICDVLGLCPELTLAQATNLFYQQQELLKKQSLLAA